MGDKSTDNDYLKIGDYVTFRSIDYSSYMCSEGILVEDMFVTDDLKQLDGCLFAIHLQRKYSAYKELQSYIRVNDIDLANTEDQDPASLKYLQALLRGRDNERTLNDTYMRDKSGQCIVFGDIIQLYHVKSRKYVKVLNGKLAKGERENMKVILDIQGDAYSWFQVSPRYKIDRDGDRIPTNSELFLRVVEKPGEFIHCANRLGATSSQREVNCALESTSWRVNIYQSSLDASDPTVLLCSQLIYINDPEKNANLTIGKNPDIGLEDQSIYTGSPASHIHEHGDLVMEPIPENGSAKSTALWLLESKKLVTGGPIAWKTQQVRIRNLNTGLYILLASEVTTDVEGSATETHVWTTTDDFTAPGTLFSIEEMIAGSNELGIGRTVKIHQKGLYLECSGESILEDKSYVVASTRAADKAVNFKLFRYVETNNGSIMSSGGSDEIIVSDNSGPMNVNVSVAARNYLRQYYHMIVIPTKLKGTTSIWPNADDSEMEFFHSIVDRMIWFSAGQSISASVPLDTINPAVQARQQVLLMEQGVVEVILRIVNRLIPISERAAKEIPSEKYFIESGNSVLSKCLSLLLACIQDNIANQMMVADYMPVLLAHLGQQDLAGQCVTEMLAKNVELQETKIGTREISIFVEKLRISRMNAMYLQLLTACCSCEGNGVDGNQCKVTNMIFEGDTDDIVIQIKPIPGSDRLFLTWTVPSLFLPEAVPADQPIRAAELIKSVPQLMLTYKASDLPEGPKPSSPREASKGVGVTAAPTPSRGVQISTVQVDSDIVVPVDSRPGTATDNAAFSRPVSTQSARPRSLPPLDSAPTSRPGTVQSMRAPTPQEPVPDAMKASAKLVAATAAANAPSKAVSFGSKSGKFKSGTVDDYGYYRFDVLDLYGEGGYLDAKDEYSVKPGMLKKRGSVSNMNKESGSTRRDSLTPSAAPMTAVASYFVQQMFLGAEMCLDRNYVAMNTLDERFPYEILITLVKMEISDKIKGAACRLLLCLHVDRDPQAEARIPSLSRSWIGVQATVAEDALSRLPSVDAKRVNEFALIQQFISEHLRSMAGKRWGDLSLHMLNLLKKLVLFNFYGTVEKLNDVIRHLVIALDRKAAEKEYDLTSRSRSQKSSRKSIRSSPADSALENSVGVDDSGISDSPAPGSMLDLMARLLEFLEGMPVLIFILCLVAVAVSLTINETITGIDAGPGTNEFIVDNVILAIFCIEVSLRIICFCFTRDTLWAFLRSTLNQIDIVVILIDFVFLGLPPELSSKGKYAKALRLIRLLRLARILRAARVVNNLRSLSSSKKSKDKWKAPLRYTKTMPHEISTMREAINILSQCQRVVEDRNLTLLLRSFHLWESGKVWSSPGELFEKVISDSSDLTLGVENFDGVCIDLLMFQSTELVQSVLELLMSHHSARRSLLNHAKVAQLMVSPKHEKLFSQVEQLLGQLERNAETHELWGELLHESDFVTNEQTKSILRELTQLCKVRRFMYDFDGEFSADKSIQDLFRNLGCFPICLKVLGLLDALEEHEEEDGTYDVPGANIVELCKLCNELLYWFLLSNPKNQEMGFTELQFFIESLDTNTNSHLVIEAIFKENDKLMRLVPHTYLFELAEKIIKCEPDERSYRDLYLFQSITNVDDLNIKENQLEIMKQLASPGRLPLVVCFFTGADTEEYNKKIELMEPYLDARDVNLEDLPPQLSYHLTLMTVFSRCTIGRYNVTTVEAKVQSVFKSEYLLESLLDPRTMLLVKIKQCFLMLNCMVDVEMLIPGFEFNAGIWKFFEQTNSMLIFGKDDIRQVEKLGWSEPEVSRHKIEFMLISIALVGAFFKRYYGPEKFRVMDGAIGGNRVHMNFLQINELIVSMLRKIKDIYDLDSPRLAKSQKASIYEAVVALNDAAPAPVYTDLQPTHLEVIKTKVDDEFVDYDVIVARKYSEYLAELEADENVKNQTKIEEQIFCNILDQLPSVEDLTVPGDVRQQVLFLKLIQHVRENLSFVNRERRLTAECTRTTIFLIRSFRTIIETRWGMTIAERDEEGGQEQDDAAASIIKAMNDTGVTALCLDLIAAGLEAELVLEAIYLCVAMLFKEGGALAIQVLMNTHLTKTDSFLLFKQMRLSIKKMVAWHEWRGAAPLPEGEEPKLLDEIIVLRFMQLMSEGHYLANQNLMREQPTNSQQLNLLDDYVLFLNCLSKLHCRTSTAAAIPLANVILEVIQGPCKGNQAYFALDTELLEIINRMLRSTVELDCVPEEEVELKKILIDILQGLVEGQTGVSPVYERVISVIHLEIILLLARGSPSEEEEEGGDESEVVEVTEPSAEETEEERILKAECMVFINMMCDYKPSLRADLKLDGAGEEEEGAPAATADESTVSVEILWAGDLQRRYFYVPSVCQYVAKTSMDALVENIDRSNNEAKLKEFIERLQTMYLEVKHQQFLSEIGLNKYFNQQNHSRATWATFYLACLINLLFLIFMHHRNGNPYLDPKVEIVVLVLSILQFAVSCFTIILSIVVRSPVVFAGQVDEGKSMFWCIVNTALEPMTLYYLGYGAFSFLGFIANRFFSTLLLLDLIVKNATCKNVLMAAYLPREALMMAAILGVFCMYIFAFFHFWFIPDSLSDDIGTPICHTLWGCMKLYLGKALLAGGGIGDLMQSTLDINIILEFLFFIVITIILLNVIFGIIIDTFSALRDEKDQRLFNTLNFCFICGIDKVVFDRAEGNSEGFDNHIKNDHKMWNYMKFIFHIWEQDRDDDDGLEQFVRRCINRNDITWFPMNKALKLTQADSAADILQRELFHDIHVTENVIGENIKNMQQEAGVILNQLKAALKADFAGDGAKVGIGRALQLMSRQGRTAAAANDDTEEVDGDNEDDEEDMGKNVYVEIDSVSGFGHDIPRDELLKLSVRVVCDTSMFSVKCDSLRPGELVFKVSEPFLIVSNADVGDDRKCLIQVLDLQGVFAGPGPGTVLGKCYGSAEIDIDELLNANGGILSKELSQEEDAHSSAALMVHIKPTVSKTGFVEVEEP